MTMIQQPSPSHPVPSAAAPEVVFRMLTPVFRHDLEGEACFTHSGNCWNARFKIELRPYNHNRSDWEHITQCTDDGIRGLLLERTFNWSDHFMCNAQHCLLTDVIYPTTEVAPATVGTALCLTVHDSAIDALRLHSSAGLACQETYKFRSPPGVLSGLRIESPNSRQSRCTHAGSPSFLRLSDFESCRATINHLLNKTWNESATFDKVLRLAMEYHRLAFTLERVDHAFLILMVAFEAMFKNKAERNAKQAAVRIGHLLGSTKSECMRIQRDFFDERVDCFCRTRNDIAHGDSGLSLMTVSDGYPKLYRHVTAAIVTLLRLPPGSLDDKNDYYDEISKLTESIFVGLANS